MVSGSTAIAANDAGVQFIGVEKTERWYGVTCDRVANYARVALQPERKSSYCMGTPRCQRPRWLGKRCSLRGLMAII